MCNILRIVSIVLFRGQRLESTPTWHCVTHYVFVNYHRVDASRRAGLFSLSSMKGHRDCLKVEVDALQIMRYIIQHN